MKITSRAELARCRQLYKKSLASQYKQVVICGGSGCVAGGSRNVYAKMQELMEAKGLKVDVRLEHEPHGDAVGLSTADATAFARWGR